MYKEYMLYKYFGMLQELLLEHADLFYHFKSIAPSGTITQDDIKEITDALLDDFRYEMLYQICITSKVKVLNFSNAIIFKDENVISIFIM